MEQSCAETIKRLVLASHGKISGRQARLELKRDALALQVPIGPNLADLIPNDSSVAPTDVGLRTVSLKRQKDSADGGFGLAIKGGNDPDNACTVPILISKIFKDQPAEQSGQLFVGDAIVEVNGYMVEGKTHEEVVRILKESSDEVSLTVKHYSSMTHYLRGGSLRRDGSGSAADRFSETGTWKSSTKAGAYSDYDRGSTTGTVSDSAPEGWKTLVKIPLPMAYITRYLWGTDKIRPNAFEVRAVDGTSTGIIHCEDGRMLDKWIQYIGTNITQLNNKSIKMSNKFLHPSELIVYLGWVCEKQRDTVDGALNQTWEPRFLILKGNDACLFDSPPLNSEDLDRCLHSYKMYETVFKAAKEGERLDGRDNCCWIETAPGLKHYLSLETDQQLSQLESAWHRATYYSVTRLQSKTFACNFEGRPSGLVLDLRLGFSLYDIPSKHYIWQYKFANLKTSADDGKMRLQLVFHNHKSPNGEDILDLDCADLYPLVFTTHAFFVTRLISLDPDFLKNPGKV